ncbi:hypothetical protein ABZ260_35375 [Streptosporangium sp. NPDC006013]|uniref:hypothetical protein n=1 Tax=Streptosporangium sp. NPDC006013 TaxID=3155596 RepID=UPI0033A0DB00
MRITGGGLHRRSTGTAACRGSLPLAAAEGGDLTLEFRARLDTDMVRGSFPALA